MEQNISTCESVDLRGFASQFAAGVTVISTTGLDSKPTGVTMTAVLSLSLNPPLFLISLDNGSNTLREIIKNRHFCINFLEEGQVNISNVFSSKGGDKFSQVSYTPGITGSPCIDGAVACGECELREQYAAGDHTIIIARVVRTVVNGGKPLIYHGGKYAALDIAS